MIVRWSLYLILLIVIHSLSWYYFTCFVAIYPNTYYGVINVFLILLIFKYIIAEIIIITIKVSLKIMLKNKG